MSPHITDGGGTDRASPEACLTFHRAAVQRRGQGKNNETSEDETELPAASSPLLCSFIPHSPEQQDDDSQGEPPPRAALRPVPH